MMQRREFLGATIPCRWQFKVTVPLPTPAARPPAKLIVAGTQPPVSVAGGKATLEVASILDHELVVLE
jgi:hypothetical protein